jgi:zinc transport system permease protein
VADFFQMLTDPEMPLLRYVLAVGVLASVAFGVVGSYVVARRITYIAAAISHSVLGGIGAALYLRHAAGWDWLDPMYGAVAAALLSAVLIGLVSLYARQREDTVISAVWTIGMAAGLLLLHLTPGYNEPMVYLFGDIWYLSARDVWIVAVCDAVIVALAVGLYPKLLAVCFDDEFAELRGVHVKLMYILLLCLAALTVVLLVRVVGVVMVIALLTLPAAIAGQFSRRLWQMMLISVGLCMLFVVTGVAGSFAADLPTGPVIVGLAAIGYLLATAVTRWRAA